MSGSTDGLVSRLAGAIEAKTSELNAIMVRCETLRTELTDAQRKLDEALDAMRRNASPGTPWARLPAMVSKPPIPLSNDVTEDVEMLRGGLGT